MKFSYNWLQSFFNKKLPKPEKLAEILTMHSFEVSEVKKLGKDFVLDIDVLPNRGPDCLSHLGIAREIGAILGLKLLPLEREKLKLEKEKKLSPLQIKIECPSLVLRYSAIVIEGVRIMPSPLWLKEKLEAVGVRSINNIVDLTNFVMFEIGQPLHAFDYDKIQGQKMILRQAEEGERVITLDDFERILDTGMLVIEDEKRLIDLVGIMGGKLSEIDSETKNIVLQAGNFDRRTIYRTTKELDQTTDASNIYARGIDPNLTIFTLERFYFLLKKLGGGKIVQIIDFYPSPAKFGGGPKKIKLDLDYLKSLLGIEIPKNEIIKILKKIEFKIVDVRRQHLLVEIPTFRLDISIPEDLVEEIGRIYGYEKIKPVFPTASLIPPKRNLERFWEEMVKDILKEAGFTEVYNYSFISEDAQRIFGNGNLIEIENPTSLDFKYLRPSLIPNLLKNVEKNQTNFKEIKIFELGKTFKKVKSQITAFGGIPLRGKSKVKMANQNSKILEKRMISGLLTGDAFFQAKGVVDLLLNKLGISKIWYDEYQPTPEDSNPPTTLPSKGWAPSKLSIWHQKRCAEIKIDNEEIGFLGEISPRVLETLKIDDKVVVFDIDFEKLQKLASEEHEYQPISPYPAAVRDIAILVPRNVKVEEVLNVIESAGGKLIRDIDLFDIYEGEEIAEGKKNLAFHIIYQAEDRTLSSEEIDNIQQKMIEALEEEPDWEVRK